MDDLDISKQIVMRRLALMDNYYRTTTNQASVRTSVRITQIDATGQKTGMIRGVIKTNRNLTINAAHLQAVGITPTMKTLTEMLENELKSERITSTAATNVNQITRNQ